MKTLDFVELLKKQYHIESDYALTKLLGLSRGIVDSWRNRNRSMSDETALIVAEKTGLPKDYVLICVMAERSNCPNVKKTLDKLAGKLRPDFLKKSA